MSVVIHDKNFSLQQCIDAAWKPLGELTDWDAVIANADQIDVEALTAELKSGEPYARTPENALTVFRAQQRIGIGMRCQKGLPQVHDSLCSSCARRNNHVARHYYRKCLYCLEQDLLIPDFRSDPYFVAFDTITNTWGIAYKSNIGHGRTNYTAVVIVNGYKTEFEASLALHAPDRFAQLYNRVCAAGFQVDESTIFSTSTIFAQNLPLNPTQWKELCNKQFLNVDTEHSEPFESELNSSCKEFFRARH